MAEKSPPPDYTRDPQPERERIRVKFHGEHVLIPVASSLEQLETDFRERMKPTAERFFQQHPGERNGIGLMRYSSPEEIERRNHDPWVKQLHDALASAGVIPDEPFDPDAPYNGDTLSPTSHFMVRRYACFARSQDAPGFESFKPDDVLVVVPGSIKRLPSGASNAEIEEASSVALESAVAIHASLLFGGKEFVYQNPHSSANGETLCYAKDMVSTLSSVFPGVLSLGIEELEAPDEEQDSAKEALEEEPHSISIHYRDREDVPTDYDVPRVTTVEQLQSVLANRVLPASEKFFRSIPSQIPRGLGLARYVPEYSEIKITDDTVQLEGPIIRNRVGTNYGLFREELYHSSRLRYRLDEGYSDTYDPEKDRSIREQTFLLGGIATAKPQYWDHPGRMELSTAVAIPGELLLQLIGKNDIHGFRSYVTLEEIIGALLPLVPDLLDRGF